jgi:hypothetical protein
MLLGAFRLNFVKAPHYIWLHLARQTQANWHISNNGVKKD